MRSSLTGWTGKQLSRPRLEWRGQLAPIAATYPAIEFVLRELRDPHAVLLPPGSTAYTGKSATELVPIVQLVDKAIRIPHDGRYDLQRSSCVRGVRASRNRR